MARHRNERTYKKRADSTQNYKATLTSLGRLTPPAWWIPRLPLTQIDLYSASVVGSLTGITERKAHMESNIN